MIWFRCSIESKAVRELSSTEEGGVACLQPPVPFPWTINTRNPLLLFVLFLLLFCINYQERAAKLGQYAIALWMTKAEQSPWTMILNSKLLLLWKRLSVY